MRARLALVYSGIDVELREVVLRDKPSELLEVSSKGTVPVMQLADGTVLDESIDIMYWALKQHDPDAWLCKAHIDEIQRLTSFNDKTFKHWLDRYKYADRFPEQTELDYRKHCETWLSQLDLRLQENDGWLIQGGCSLADIAILPFIRQFAHVDLNWFEQSQFGSVLQWLNAFKESTLFDTVMRKYEKWAPENEQIIFPDR